MGDLRCRNPSIRVDLAEIDRVSSLLSQLFEIVKLCTPIAFSEWMDIVHVAQDFPGHRRKRSATRTAKKIRPLKPPVNIRHTGFDVPPELELMAALGYLHGSKFARPIMDILKQMPVNGAKVRKVEAPFGSAFGCPLDRKSPLGSIEQRRISNAKLVAEYGRTRIGVWIVVHSVARVLTLARI